MRKKITPKIRNPFKEVKETHLTPSKHSTVSALSYKKKSSECAFSAYNNFGKALDEKRAAIKSKLILIIYIFHVYFTAFFIKFNF